MRDVDRPEELLAELGQDRVTADAADALGVALCHAAHGGFKRRTAG